MNMPIELTNIEREARALLAGCPVPWSPEATMIRSIFRWQYAASFTADDITAIGKATYCVTEWDPQPVLTAMVRAKTLRSRTVGGRRLYEVALAV